MVKRGYVQLTPLPDAATALQLLPAWLEGRNARHPHSALKMRSPREPAEGPLRERVLDRLGLVSRLLRQTAKDRGRIYALHEPQVGCISRGEARVRYEFGPKVGVATTLDGGFAVGPRALPVVGAIAGLLGGEAGPPIRPRSRLIRSLGVSHSADARTLVRRTEPPQCATQHRPPPKPTPSRESWTGTFPTSPAVHA